MTDTFPRRFHLVRTEDESGVSGCGVIVEGVAFTDGTVALRWLTATTSTAVYASMADVETIHGHAGKTRIAWIDPTDHGDAACNDVTHGYGAALLGPCILERPHTEPHQDVNGTTWIRRPGALEWAVRQGGTPYRWPGVTPPHGSDQAEVTYTEGEILRDRDGVMRIPLTGPGGSEVTLAISPTVARILAGKLTEPCCVCGSGDVVYHNYRDQPFCWPCADCQCGQTPCVRDASDDEHQYTTPSGNVHRHLGRIEDCQLRECADPRRREISVLSERIRQLQTEPSDPADGDQERKPYSDTQGRCEHCAEETCPPGCPLFAKREGNAAAEGSDAGSLRAALVAEQKSVTRSAAKARQSDSPLEVRHNLDGMATGLDIAIRLHDQHHGGGAQDAGDELVQVGWWCWRGDNHGHLTAHACRSDNVPIHVPAEWATDMEAVIQRITDGDELEQP